MADRMFPGKYQSDFAVQVTSELGNSAQQHTINFANNNLLGSAPITYEHLGEDILSTIKEETIGFDGIRQKLSRGGASFQP
jgi:type I restriction enzyme R subunit